MEIFLQWSKWVGTKSNRWENIFFLLLIGHRFFKASILKNKTFPDIFLKISYPYRVHFVESYIWLELRAYKSFLTRYVIVHCMSQSTIVPPWIDKKSKVYMTKLTKNLTKIWLNLENYMPTYILLFIAFVFCFHIHTYYIVYIQLEKMYLVLHSLSFMEYLIKSFHCI